MILGSACLPTEPTSEEGCDVGGHRGPLDLPAARLHLRPARIQRRTVSRVRHLSHGRDRRSSAVIPKPFSYISLGEVAATSPSRPRRGESDRGCLRLLVLRGSVLRQPP